MFYNEELVSIINNVLKSGIFVRGENTRKFEKNWAQYCNQKYSITFNSGTSALSSIISFLKTKYGAFDVILPSFTFIANILPIISSNLNPVFVDVNEQNYCVALKKVRSKITKNTHLIIIVDLYGTSIEKEEFYKFCKENEIFLLEDACQAAGLVFNGNKPGTYADATIYSFYPSKNISVLGEGGMVTTNNRDLYEYCLKFRNYGLNKDGVAEVNGINGFLSEIHSAIGLYQIPLLDKWNQKRKDIAKRYILGLKELIENNQIITPTIEQIPNHVFHLFVIRLKNRDALKRYLSENGIQSKIHSPVPLHLHPLVKTYLNTHRRNNDNFNDLQITENLVKEVLSLPISPFHTEEEIDFVIEQIISFFN